MFAVFACDVVRSLWISHPEPRNSPKWKVHFSVLQVAQSFTPPLLPSSSLNNYILSVLTTVSTEQREVLTRNLSVSCREQSIQGSYLILNACALGPGRQSESQNNRVIYVCALQSLLSQAQTTD